MEVRNHIKRLNESTNILLKESESIEQQIGVGEQTVLKIQNIKMGLIKHQKIVQEISKELYKSDELNGQEKLELEQEVRNLMEKVAELENKMTILEMSKVDNQKQVARLEDALRQKDEEITGLNRKVERHEIKWNEMESALQTGQIAFEFEKDLAKYIYPHDKKFSSRKIFTNMKKWLEDKKDTEQGREANERWNELKNEFLWSSQHEEVFFKLLKFRQTFAHPAYDQNKARFSIPDCFTDKEKKCIEVINKMLERVSILLQQ